MNGVKNNPFEGILPIFKRIDFVNCKFINCTIENYEGELTMYCLNCEFKIDIFEKTRHLKKHYNICNEHYISPFSFYKGTLVMKSCKITDIVFHFKDSSSVLMIDNIFLYTEDEYPKCHDDYIHIENLKSRAILERNVFYIQNIDKKVCIGLPNSYRIKFTNSESEPNISFCNNYIYSNFVYEIEEYFYPDIFLEFGIDKLKLLKFHKNIYIECINKKENRRPISFDSECGYLCKTPCLNLVLDIKMDKSNVDSNEFWDPILYPGGITEKYFLRKLLDKCKEVENFQDFHIKISKNQYSETKIRSQYNKEDLVREYQEKINKKLEEPSLFSRIFFSIYNMFPGFK